MVDRDPHHPKVFISYSHESLEHSDRVRELSDRLRADGLDCTLDQYEVSPSEGWPRWMDRQIRDADFVLMICTETYCRRVMGDETAGTGLGVRWEGNLIYQHIYNPGTVNAKFVPLLLESGKFEDIPTPLQGGARFAAQTEEGYEELYRLLTDQPLHLKPALGDVRKLQPLAPKKRKQDFFAAQLTNLPFERNPFFTGRERILKDLRAAFSRKKAGSTSHAISGLGGLGKTQIAIEFAYRHRDQYKAVFWVRANSPLELSAGFVELARLLALPEKDSQIPDDAVHAVLQWLEENSGWLLIFDNAERPEQLKGFRPRNATGHTLVTSRAQVFDTLGISKPFELDVMLPEEAIKFLFTRKGRDGDKADEKEAAAHLAQELGYLPLALEQAGAFITAKQARFYDYLASYRKRRLELLKESRPITGDYSESVATTWAINFSEIEKTSEAASDLLRTSAFLSPDRIPLELIAKGKSELGPALSAALADVCDDPLALNLVWEPLTRYSLIRLDSDLQTYSIHRLVQEVLRDGMDEDTQRLWTERTLRALDEVFPYPEFNNWPLCERLLPHVKVAGELMERWEVAFAEAGRLPNEAALFCFERGQYSDAESLFTRAFAIGERTLAPYHHAVAVAVGLNNLANLYNAQGKYSEAEPLLRQSLFMYETALGSEHPLVAPIQNNLASLCKSQGKYNEAKSLYLRSLATTEKALGENHPKGALILNNLADLYRLQGRYDEAESLFKRSLTIREKTLEPNHPFVAQSVNNLASLYQAQGKYGEAEPLYKRSLATREKSLGSTHPDVAQTLNNLAEIYRVQGRYTEADPLYKRSLIIYEKALGPDHPDVALSLNNLALLHQAQCKYREAEPLFARSLAVHEKALGSDHPSVAVSLSNLALLYCDQGKYFEAEPLFKRALDILVRALGPDHPHVAAVLNNYAALLRATQRNG